jgi:uncharacterized Zn finger protein (UPF0148 family)
MSYDPQSPSDRRDAEPDNACPRCGALDCTPNVEAFEEFGDVMCDECAEAAFVAQEEQDEEDLRAELDRMLAAKIAETPLQ